MEAITWRRATLTDTAGIVAVHCSHVETWRRDGRGEPVPYDSLTLYERWLHGGPWMSTETCAIHLSRVLDAGWSVLVAQQGDEIVGEAEFLENAEPSPYGPTFHLSLLFVHAAHQQRGVGRALLEAGERLARERGCAALTTQPERPAEPFYRRAGFAPWLWLREWQARAREQPLLGEPEALPHALYPADEPLVLRAGRYQCGRQAWDDLPFRMPFPEHTALRWGRWRLALPGGAVWLGLRSQPLEPSQADGFIWTRPGADLPPAIAALQTLAARMGFTAVDMLLEEPEGHELAATLGFEHQTDLMMWRKEIP